MFNNEAMHGLYWVGLLLEAKQLKTCAYLSHSRWLSVSVLHPPPPPEFSSKAALPIPQNNQASADVSSNIPPPLIVFPQNCQFPLGRKSSCWKRCNRQARQKTTFFGNAQDHGLRLALTVASGEMSCHWDVDSLIIGFFCVFWRITCLPVIAIIESSGAYCALFPFAPSRHHSLGAEVWQV